MSRRRGNDTDELNDIDETHVHIQWRGNHTSYTQTQAPAPRTHSRLPASPSPHAPLPAVISVGGVTMRDAISEWYFQKRGPPAGGTYWAFDVPFPGNPTCPGGNSGRLGLTN